MRVYVCMICWAMLSLLGCSEASTAKERGPDDIDQMDTVDGSVTGDSDIVDDSDSDSDSDSVINPDTDSSIDSDTASDTDGSGTDRDTEADVDSGTEWCLHGSRECRGDELWSCYLEEWVFTQDCTVGYMVCWGSDVPRCDYPFEPSECTHGSRECRDSELWECFLGEWILASDCEDREMVCKESGAYCEYPFDAGPDAGFDAGETQ